MADLNQYIKDGLKIADQFLNEKNFSQALSACQELLKVNPYDRKLHKYLRRIEEHILEENIKKVDHDIDATMHLWKEGRFDDLFQIYARLIQYAPDHRKLKKLIEKLGEQMTDKERRLVQDNREKALANIQELMVEKRLGDALQAGNELLKADPLNTEAGIFVSQIKNLIIEQKMAENERILDSADFERQIEFFTGLLSLQPNHEKVKKLLLKAQAHAAEQRMIAAKIHLNESISRMKELFKNAEYEKVIQACEEIDRQDSGNFSAKIFRKKAIATMDAEIEVLAVKKLQEAWGVMKGEVEKRPEGYIRI